MPTFGWILESAVDRWADSQSPNRPPVVVQPDVRPPIWSCHLPECGQRFASERGLDDHIYEAHRHVDLVLRVGHRIYTDSHIVIDEPAPVLVATDGLDGVSVALALPPAWTERTLAVQIDGRRRLVSLPDDIASSFPARLRLIVRWGSSSRTFDLYYKSAVELDETAAQTIESAVIRLQDAVLHGRPDWTTAQREFDRLPELERRYGLGLFEYLYAHSEAETDRPVKESHQHFERAHWLLSPFSRPLARMASDLIVFRLGWYDRLARTTVRRLEGATCFFRVPPSPPLVDQERSAAGAVKLILDDFHQVVLEVVDAYWSGAYAQAAERLTKLANSPRLIDRHLSEKYQLLKARIASAMGDVSLARSSYGDLVDSVWFRGEARAFV